MQLADLHTHTYLCNHASGAPDEYLAAAKSKNLSYFGISDHFPAPDGYDAKYRMMMLEYDIYRSIVNDLKEKSSAIGGPEVLYGTEFDYVPGRMKEVCDALSREDFDYTIGSIHYIGDFAFDDPDKIAEWHTRGIDETWARYTELLCEFIHGFNFEILGHADLPKKFGFKHSNDAFVLKKMRAVFEMASRKGICLELNTAGLRREAKEIYPSLDILKEAFASGMGITFGSDAHSPTDVAADFDKARDLAEAAGYRSHFVFKKKTPVEIPFDS